MIGSVQADSRRPDFALQVESKAGSRNPDPTAKINVLRRRAPKRRHLNNTDRFCLAWFPSALGAIAIVRPETIIRWHRAGFRAYWRWRSRNPVGRLKVSPELRTLIGEMSQANPHCRIDPASSGSSCHPAESGRPSSDNSSSCRPGKVIPPVPSENIIRSNSLFLHSNSLFHHKNSLLR
jgi:hypothetical protein